MASASAGSRGRGVQEAVVEAVRCGRIDHLDEDLRLALELVEALTATPARVDGQLYQRLRASFSERALLELATAITWKNYLARFNRLYAVSDPGTFASNTEV